MAEGVPLVRRLEPAQHDGPGRQPRPPRRTKRAEALALEVRYIPRYGRRGVRYVWGHGTGGGVPQIMHGWCLKTMYPTVAYLHAKKGTALL